MRVKKASSVDYVHQFTEIAHMKFKPKKINFTPQQPKQQNPFMSRIKSFISWKTPSVTDSRVSRTSTHSILSRSSSQISIKSVALQGQCLGLNILFLEKITPEHYLIGNANQIDLVNIGGVVGNFVDTESLWQLNIGKPINRIAIDSKKGYIAIQTTQEILVYSFEYKKIKQKPKFIAGIKTAAEAQYMHFTRDSILAVFRGNFMDVYLIQETKLKKKMCKQFKEAQKMILFQVPPPIQNCINVFYTRQSQTSKTFELWYKQVDFKKESTADCTDLMKVYDIKEDLYKKIRLENYSREIFLMNLGFEILACKKGYIIDSAYLNLQEESTFLNYIGNNRLLHLSPTKAQIYRFKINLSLNPPRIQINSLDSIQIIKPKHFEYIGALEMFNRNFAVFYQIVPDYNHRTKGEIAYCFAITKHVTIQQKIKQIFTIPFGVELKNMDLGAIQERVDMARKIGLNRIEIYLELWNRTNKQDVDEFKFLLDTLDYDTIKKQIEKKLKKSSMFFREIYKIQQSCFDMIRQNLFSSQCNQQVVKEYLTSHILLRKLQLYRDITVYEKQTNGKNSDQEGDALKINIQNYNKYMKADLKNLFLQMINEYCLESKNILMQIRIFLRNFRFIFRIIYKDLLEDIVKNTKGSLITLLQNFPELLPYKHMLADSDDPTLYQGVWEEISRTQWEKNVHIEGISTIDNRQIIAEIPKTLWFRRYFLTQHDMTGKSNEQILKIHKSNNSDEIFYFFISKVFEYIYEQTPLHSIISLIQKNYEKMPNHLSHKIFLYRKLFEYIREHNLAKDNQKLQNFHQLLKMKDFELFKEFFKFEKLKKGCLLKDIKRIYEQVGGTQQGYILQRGADSDNQEYCKTKIPAKGVSWFNQGLLSYFSSDLSEVSDLKYILNRINNEKRQFHAENENLIFILVEAVQLKLKVGSENDVPITEILLYLETIPITPENPVLQQLQKIQKINEQVQRFQQIKLNMTIAEITKNCQTVVNALINYEIKKRNVLQVNDIQQMKEISYDIIAEIQIVKQKIYKNQYSDLTFFVYLTKIMEEIRMIPYAAELLQDQYLIKYFSVDLKVVEDLILYMYKLKLTQNPKYIENEKYLLELLQILPEDNQCRIYIKCQLQYAKILSAPKNPVQYPLTDKSDGISIVQLQERIQQLSGDFLLTIDIEELHELMNKMQQICYEDFEDNFYTSLNEIYEVVIIRLIEQSKIVQSIPLVKKLLKLENNPYGIVFPLFYIDILSAQLTCQCKANLLKAVSFLFNEPLQLIRIVEQLMGNVFTNQESDDYFRELAQKSAEFHKNYNPKNPILDPIYIELIRNEQMENNFREMVEQCASHLIKSKQEFNKFQFSLLFIVLTQNPFSLAKFIFCRRYQTNYKVMRSFLSYVIKEEIFDSLRVLEFGRRIFNIISEASTSMLTIESIISQYSTIPMDETIQFQQLDAPEPVVPDDEELIKKFKILDSKVQKCIGAFDKKKASVMEQLVANGPKQTLEQRKEKIQKQLTNPIDLSDQAPSQYPFGDSDDDYGQEEKFDEFATKSRRKNKKQFDPSLERSLLMNRTNKNYALFMSTENKKNDKLYMSSRGGLVSTNRKLKTAKSFGLNSLRMTQLANSNNRPKSGLMNQSSNNPHKKAIDQHLKLTESIADYDGIHVSKSAVLKDKRSKFYAQQQMDSPAVRISFNKSEFADDRSQQDHGFELRNMRTALSSDNFDRKSENKSQQQDDRQKPEQKDYYLTVKNTPAQVQQNNQDDAKSANSGFSYHVTIKQVDQNEFMPISKLKGIILDSVNQDKDANICVNLGQLSLEQDKENGKFQAYLIQLIKQIYADEMTATTIKLKVIKQIESLYPDIGISKQFLQVFIRFESYHSKYDIKVPMQEMFPIQNIFLPSKDLKQLFNAIAPNIVQLVDQSNIYKISKIIHLAFKASSFEHEFFFSYLCIASEKYDASKSSSTQQTMMLEKLSALIQKLPVNLLIDRGQKIVESMLNQQKKQNIIKSMIEYIKKKKNIAEAQKFQQKILVRGG